MCRVSVRESNRSRTSLVSLVSPLCALGPRDGIGRAGCVLACLLACLLACVCVFGQGQKSAAAEPRV
ncbi:hypothetical protein LX32DRAFT_647395 [Colletotrichum zoysiae]|uniref:Uncharacterized protein n=1 Tax=Colletotrichum zoysiae TaxID=1216348 RepID=A0AAD9H283_9PEZI|nr:hypothetical protein LX32DRAFT_647395 [Colletotrichum zoysiae]